jgi:hypothetical protein
MPIVKLKECFDSRLGDVAEQRCQDEPIRCHPSEFLPTIFNECIHCATATFWGRVTNLIQLIKIYRERKLPKVQGKDH